MGRNFRLLFAAGAVFDLNALVDPLTVSYSARSYCSSAVLFEKYFFEWPAKQQWWQS